MGTADSQNKIYNYSKPNIKPQQLKNKAKKTPLERSRVFQN